MNTEQFIVELARLRSRVETLETGAFASVDEYVEGWTLSKTADSHSHEA